MTKVFVSYIVRRHCEPGCGHIRDDVITAPRPIVTAEDVAMLRQLIINSLIEGENFGVTILNWKELETSETRRVDVGGNLTIEGDFSMG